MAAVLAVGKLTHESSPQRLLFVLDDCGPGDALVVDFCLDAVLRAHPGAQADLLVSEQAAPVFARDQRFHSIVTSRLYEQRSRRRLLLLVLKLREALRLALRLRRRYDLTLTFYWGTTLLNMIARWATLGTSLGFANAFPRLLNSRLGRYRPADDPLEQASRLLEAAGLQAAPAVPPPRGEGSEAHEAAVLLGEHGLGDSGRLAVLHIGSDWACQQWLPERWAQLADRLVSELDLEVAFTGVQAEARVIDRIRGQMSAASISLAGATSVAQLSALLNKAALCVCVDSLAFQLAQGRGIPSVVLAGQSRTETTELGGDGPIVVNRTTPQLRAAILACKLTPPKASYGGCLHYRCPMAGLREIGVDDVMNAVTNVLTHAGGALRLPEREGLTAQ